jgi:cytochrome c553
MRRSGCAAVFVTLAFAGGAAADDATFGDERTVPSHLDHGAIARGEIPAADLLAHGRELFEARFTSLDGAGRPRASAADVPTHRPGDVVPAFLRTSGPDASACSGCHSQPVTGGAGDFAVNVFVAPQDIEYDFDSLAPELSMERGTTHLMGGGLLELVAREMTADLQGLRDRAAAEARSSTEPVRVRLVTKGVDFGWLEAAPDGTLNASGIQGVHPDLIVRPFSQKAVVISLRQFTVNALNTHHGMQAEERFGTRWTDEADFDGDGHEAELSEGDVTALTLFQAALPPPAQMPPEDKTTRAAAAEGERLFAATGCTSCHVPALPLESAVFAEPGPYNPAGTLRAQEAPAVGLDLGALFGPLLRRDAEGRVLVPAFTDLKRNVIADRRTPHFANEKLTHNFVTREQFRTAPLWGVASTAPYGHRGDLTTLTEAILAHGGEATASRDAFVALDELDRRRVIAFLQTLCLPEALP